MPRRDQRLLLALAALAVLLAVLQSTVGFDANLLLAVPVLVVALPLLAGRYVGEDAIARLAGRARPEARVRPAALAPRAPVPRRLMARGTLLLAASLAERGPPRAGASIAAR